VKTICSTKTIIFFSFQSYVISSVKSTINYKAHSFFCFNLVCMLILSFSSLHSTYEILTSLFYFCYTIGFINWKKISVFLFFFVFFSCLKKIQIQIFLLFYLDIITFNKLLKSTHLK